MPPVDKPNATRAPWRSLAELADAPEFRAFLEAEFPAAADPGGISRRRWLQLMGASLTLAGVAGCRWEKEEIAPFAKRPEGRTPGKPQKYATAMDLGGNALGLLVTSYDGRPIKVEGNPLHPASLGATDAFAQAAILGLYDPDRSANVVQTDGGQPIVHESWGKFDAFARGHFAELRKSGGEGLRVLSEASRSETLARLSGQLLEAFPKARWHEYEPLGDDNQREARHLDLTKARVIVCLDADLFGTHPAAVRLAREFATKRAPHGTPEKAEDLAAMPRLYAVESSYTITGASADHRLPLRAGQIGVFAEELLRLLRVLTLGDRPAKVQAGGPEHVARFLLAVAKDLAAHPGQCVVVAGPGQPVGVHLVVDELNDDLGSFKKTFAHTPDVLTSLRTPRTHQVKDLAADIDAGEVTTLVILGGNPVYNAPVDLDFAAALAKVPTSIHLSLYRDETSRRCAWHLPQAHFLESWGDARARDGTYSVVQPLIDPLWGGRSAIELVSLLLDSNAARPMELVRNTFKSIARDKDLEKRWRRTLHDGLLAGNHRPGDEKAKYLLMSPPERDLGEELSPDWSPDDLEIVFRPDASVYDGRFANNAWLQEMPDPMTKLTWDNAAVMSPATAEGLGVEGGQVVRLKYRGRELELPVLLMPGVAPGSVTVSLGYGRTAAGRVGGSEADGVAPVGVNVYAIRTSDAMYFDRGLTIEPTGRTHPLATTQDHWAIDTVGMRERGRRVGEVVRSVTRTRYDEYQKLPQEEREHQDITGHELEHPPLVSLWKEHSYEGRHRWGMAIDLSRCTGCGACVVACQAENNVPVVGKEQVLHGREMHWIRVDRYFEGEPDAADLRAVHQPLPCQQCEMAPCEQVCPVGATVHSLEGLNDMVYNRCVGTRYCANNCPYKVRRFNFFNFHKDLKKPENEVLKMAYNPEVTVRCRGVMEKCTYCVQRIQAAKIEAKNHRRPVGPIQTACQQVCPAGAIVFGDLADEKSPVYGAHASDRAYGLLAELNTKPRTAYLARVRNVNPELEEGG